MGILISSHNLAELESFCNKVTIIKNGKIVETNNINEVKKVEQSYIIEVDNLDDISKILDMKIEKINDTKFRLNIKKEQAPQIVKKLVEADKKIYTVTEEILSLEDAFLKKTGGNVIEQFNKKRDNKNIKKEKSLYNAYSYTWVYNLIKCNV